MRRAAAVCLATFTIATMLGASAIPDAGVADTPDGIGRLLRLREHLDRERPKPRHRTDRGRSRSGGAANAPGHRHGCFAHEVEAAILAAAGRYRIDPNLIRAVISVESAGDPRAVSGKGARGLMQVMPATGRDLGVHDPAVLFDVNANVTAGTQYLRYTYDRFGNWPDALGAYNAGPGSIARGRVPAETRRYVRRVLALHRDYSLSRCG